MGFIILPLCAVIASLFYMFFTHVILQSESGTFVKLLEIQETMLILLIMGGVCTLFMMPLLYGLKSFEHIYFIRSEFLRFVIVCFVGGSFSKGLFFVCRVV